MDYKKVLGKLGFVEGRDFSLNAVSFDMLQQSRMVDQIIHHDLVPAVLDTDGITILSPEVAAYDETIQVPELFTLPAPTQLQLDETWKQVQLSEADVSLLVNEYLKGKDLLRDHENDSINIVNGNIHSWNFTNIPHPTIDELVALIPVVADKNSEEKRKSDLIALGKKSREACQNCLDLIAGFNVQRALTADQVTSMQTSFSDIQMALMTSRPSAAKALISALVPDEVIVTTEMKATVLSELAGF